MRTFLRVPVSAILVAMFGLFMAGSPVARADDDKEKDKGKDRSEAREHRGHRGFDHEARGKMDHKKGEARHDRGPRSKKEHGDKEKGKGQCECACKCHGDGASASEKGKGEHRGGWGDTRARARATASSPAPEGLTVQEPR